MDRPITGSIEVTARGWLHIRLDTLLPHCRFGSAARISDAIRALMDDFREKLPYFERAVLVIDEHSGYDVRRVYDSDNKAWKAIPNALKGRVFEDDDQFTLSICLLGKHSNDIGCHIFVLPPEDAFVFFGERFGGTFCRA